MQIAPSPIAGSASGMYATNDRAVVYFFAPNHAHRLGIQAHRPLLYRFEDQFVNKALDVTNASAAGAGPDHLTMVETLLRSDDARKSLLTADQPDTLINLNPLNDYFRFMMILNKPKAPDFGGTTAFSPMVNHRVIITGYCLDEPLNRFTNTPNPDCQLVFTHKSVYETLDVITPMGQQSGRLDTRYDAHIVNHALPSLTTDSDLFYIDPTNSYDATYDNAGGQTMSAPGHEQKVGWNEINKAISTKFDNPESNMKHVLGNIIASQREVTDRPHMAHMYNETHVTMPHQQMETFHEVLSRNMRSFGNSAALLGPNENEVLTIGMLVSQYDPVFQPVLSDGTSMFGVMDQTLITPNNMFCSLLASAIPSLMASSALAAIQFKVDTYFDKNDPLHDKGLRIESIIPSMPMTGETMTTRARVMLDEMSRTVFRTLYSLRGDFTLHASVDMGGMTHLWLHFKCDAQQYMEPYEVPTCLGGLTTTSFGTSTSIATNSTQMSEFVTRMTMDSMMPPPGYNPMMGGMGAFQQFGGLPMGSERPDLAATVFDDIVGNDTPPAHHDGSPEPLVHGYSNGPDWTL